VRVLYSFNKSGREAEVWHYEIARASSDHCEFVPFNHQIYLDPSRYVRAQLLDNLYYERDAGLFRLYAGLERLLGERRFDAMVVDNCPPYHPEFLRTLDIYKLLRVSDGPIVAYDRDFAYLHAYDHCLYHSVAYSRDMSMPEKLNYLGCRRHTLWPLGLFESAFRSSVTEDELFRAQRDISVVYVGAMHVGKMPLLATVKRALGTRCKIHGLVSLKKNLYMKLRYRMPGWITPIAFDEYVPIYQRSKVGFNIHNRGPYTTGNFRLFELPANGVLQISDGGRYLDDFFRRGSEIVDYDDTDALLAKIDYYLTHDQERIDLARAGFRAVKARHLFSSRMSELCELIGREISLQTPKSTYAAPS
jgi:spore maturation protein CgeB